MPVIGHAFVGWATAIAARPRALGRLPAPGIRDAFWVPILILLAYLPDIASQFAVMAGWPAPTRATHSMVVAIAASSLVAWPLAAVTRVSYRLAVGVAAFSLLAHDVLDLLQSPNRRPFWPLSRKSFAGSTPLLWSDPLGEAVLFGGAFLVFLVAWRMLAGRDGRRESHRTRPWDRSFPWRDAVLTGAILACAVSTHLLRGIREDRFRQAGAEIERHEFRRALLLLDDAQRWPSTARPGRVESLRAEAYAGLGEQENAERSYLRALHADPTEFWALADLVLLYASEPASVERQRRLDPQLERLKRNFADHEALPRVLEKVERKLRSGTSRSGG